MDIFTNKNVLLLGGTGYLGTLLSNELLNHDVNRICIVSRDEFKQFCFKESKKGKNREKLEFVIGDVRDENSIKPIFKDMDYIFDFAAMKHVSICEENPLQAIYTNVVGTSNVGRCAIEMGVKKVILASSDKSVSATNTYGATKLLAEKIFYHNSNMSNDTSFSVARLVNILGSRGSVLDKWKYQIENGQPVTITHPDMIRYFITGKEAVQFLLRICGYTGSSMLFVPRFHKIRISDLCTAFINYMCDKYVIDKSSIQIVTTGMCEVEKFEESIFNHHELKKKIDITNEMYSVYLKDAMDEAFDVTNVNSMKQSEIYELLQKSEYLQEDELVPSCKMMQHI